MLAVNEVILEELAARRVDYPTRIASRRGLHVNFVEERCRVLGRMGLVEAVSREVTYRITDQGIRALNGELSGTGTGTVLDGKR